MSQKKSKPKPSERLKKIAKATKDRFSSKVINITISNDKIILDGKEPKGSDAVKAKKIFKAASKAMNKTFEDVFKEFDKVFDLL